MSETTLQTQPRRSIRRQLLMGNIFISGLLLITGVVLLVQVNRLVQATTTLQDAENQTEAALAAQTASSNLIAAVSQLLPLEEAETFDAALSENLAELTKSREMLSSMEANSPEVLQVDVDSSLTTINNLIGIAETMRNQANNEQWPSVRVRMGILIRDQQLLTNQLNILVEHTEEIEDQAAIQLKEAQRAVTRYPAIALITAVVLISLLTYQTNISVGRPIVELSNVVSRIAEGDLDQRVHIAQDNEFRQLGRAFNLMAAEIQRSQTELEQRVADRTQALQRRAVQLQAAADVGRAATTIRDLDALLTEVTHLISQRFDFYHVGIFFLDKDEEYAVLQATNSGGGQRMLARGHKLQVGGTSIVGTATATRKPHIALDVGQDAVYFDNPDLPETRSEMALPLIVGDTLLGVLDVQSKRQAAFSDDDIAVLQVLADQVAVAIENARLFTENQEALELARRAYSDFSQASWGELLRARPQLGFRSTELRDLIPVSEEWSEDLLQVSEKGESVQIDPHTLAIPIVLRDQVLGVVRLTKAEETPPWSEEEIQLMDTLIEQLEIALESARLFSDTRRRAERERLVTEITTKIRSTTDPQSMLETAVRELRNALGSRRAQIVLRPVESIAAED